MGGRARGRAKELDSLFSRCPKSNWGWFVVRFSELLGLSYICARAVALCTCALWCCGCVRCCVLCCRERALGRGGGAHTEEGEKGGWRQWRHCLSDQRLSLSIARALAPPTPMPKRAKEVLCRPLRLSGAVEALNKPLQGVRPPILSIARKSASAAGEGTARFDTHPPVPQTASRPQSVRDPKQANLPGSFTHATSALLLTLSERHDLVVVVVHPMTKKARRRKTRDEAQTALPSLFTPPPPPSSPP